MFLCYREESFCLRVYLGRYFSIFYILVYHILIQVDLLLMMQVLLSILLIISSSKLSINLYSHFTIQLILITNLPKKNLSNTIYPFSNSLSISDSFKFIPHVFYSISNSQNKTMISNTAFIFILITYLFIIFPTLGFKSPYQINVFGFIARYFVFRTY